MRIEEHADISAAPERVWEFIGDPDRFTALDAGFIVERRGRTRVGLGARYRAMLRVGPVPVGGNVEIVEYVPGRELAWTSLTGIDQRFRVRVRDVGDGRSRLTIRFGYSSPGALGFVADVVAFGQVRGVIRRLLGAARAAAEA